jgi:hypothetical protein
MYGCICKVGTTVRMYVCTTTIGLKDYPDEQETIFKLMNPG